MLERSAWAIKRLVLGIVAIYAACAFAKLAETATFSGRVTDPAGASIGRAMVAIHWNISRAGDPAKPSKTDYVVYTNRFGEFSIKLRPGFYDVCIHSAGFSPDCEMVPIGPRANSPYKAVLKPNPQITNERGDIFDIQEMTGNAVPTETPDLPGTHSTPK